MLTFDASGEASGLKQVHVEISVPSEAVTPCYPVIRRLSTLLPCVVFFMIALVLTLTRVVNERIYMDEQLFLGGAGLMARGEGLIYRDFFYNHMPTQALLMAGLFRVTKHWTLAARAFDALCGAALAAVIFEASRRAFVHTAIFWRVMLAASVASIFLFNPVTADAVGKAWNHDLAALSAVAGFVLLAKGLATERPRGWVIASGALAAIAVTTRLTLAPPLIGFPLLILLAPGHAMNGRLRLLGLWTLGGIIAALPAILVFLQSPQNAYFENVNFPRLTQRHHVEVTGNQRVTLARKYDFIWSVVARSWPLIVIVWLTIVTAIAAIRPLRIAASLVHARFACLVVVLLAACGATLLPTPIFHQYLYSPIPFAALAIGWGLASLGVERRWWTRVLLITLAAFCIFHGRDSYRGISNLASPSEWTTTEWHRDGKRLARLAKPGKILTFVPGLALEAGLPIYDKLSIGRYAARIADYLTPEQRAAMNVPDLAAMRRWFTDDPPGAVLLVDPRSDLEAEIARIALEHGYVPQSFRDQRTLYLPPQ